MFFFRVTDIIVEKKKWVNQYIDKEIFEKLKMEEYTKENKIGTKKTIFKEELKYENIGSYNDLGIELPIFEKHNERFNLEKSIIDSYRENTEEELLSFLKETLDNPEDAVFKKYKDEKLNEEQFNEAYNTLLLKNSTYLETDAKPTHHLLIPLPEDIDVFEKKEDLNEQKTILSFSKNFMNDFINFTYDQKSDDVFFSK